MATGSAIPPSLSRKIKKVLAINCDDAKIREALFAVSDLCQENTAQNRRALKSKIEDGLIQVNQEFLDHAGTVVSAVADSEKRLKAVARSCDAIDTEFLRGREATDTLLEQADSLSQQLHNVKVKASVVDRFLADYQLGPDDSETLRDGEISEPFFVALERVTRVHRNCWSLLQSQHQRAGLELLDSMASIQEVAFERLCKWVQVKCQELADVDPSEVPELLARATRALAHRPTLLQFCAVEVASARQGAVFQSFLLALTQGGPNGVPKPMESLAQDPKRYVAAMLGWVHQAIAGEKDLLDLLFQATASTHPSPLPSPMNKSGTSEPPGVHVPALLDKVFEGLCRPLRSRIEQLLALNPPPLLAFHLHQLLSFYATTMQQHLDATSALVSTVGQVRDMSGNVFHDLVKSRLNKLLKDPAEVPRNLECAQAILDVVQLLVEATDIFEASMNGGLPGNTAAESFDHVLGALLTPLVTACERSAATLATPGGLRKSGGLSAAAGGAADGEGGGGLPPSADRIYFINCLHAVWAPLGVRRASAARADALHAQMQQEVAVLTEAETQRLASDLGILDVLERARLYRAPASEAGALHTMANDPDLSLAAVAGAMHKMFVTLASSDAVPDYATVSAPQRRASVVAGVSQGLADIYRELFEQVTAPESGYTDAAATIRNTPAHVDTLLGVDRPSQRSA